MTDGVKDQRERWRPELQYRGAFRKWESEAPFEGKDDSELTIGDLVGWAYNKNTKERELFVPMVSICHQCNGCHSLFIGWPFTNKNRHVNRPDLAAQIRAIKYGMGVRHWDNPPERFEPCDCKKTLALVIAELEERGFVFEQVTRPGYVAGMLHRKLVSLDWVGGQDGKPVDDSMWNLDESTSRPQRGIRDYERTISFPRELATQEAELLVSWLQHDQCPGWTGVSMRGSTRVVDHLGELHSYVWRTTWDSSD